MFMLSKVCLSIGNNYTCFTVDAIKTVRTSTVVFSKHLVTGSTILTRRTDTVVDHCLVKV